jgi:hypothetical protein
MNSEPFLQSDPIISSVPSFHNDPRSKSEPFIFNDPTKGSVPTFTSDPSRMSELYEIHYRDLVQVRENVQEEKCMEGCT